MLRVYNCWVKAYKIIITQLIYFCFITLQTLLHGVTQPTPTLLACDVLTRPRLHSHWTMNSEAMAVLWCSECIVWCERFTICEPNTPSPAPSAARKGPSADDVRQQWVELKKYLDPNPQLRNTDQGRHAPKVKSPSYSTYNLSYMTQHTHSAQRHHTCFSSLLLPTAERFREGLG